MKRWQLQEAKARFSEVIKNALNDEPQEITLRKEPAVVVISIKEYQKLKKPKLSFVEFMANSPLKGIDIKFERDRSLPRDIKL